MCVCVCVAIHQDLALIFLTAKKKLIHFPHWILINKALEPKRNRPEATLRAVSVRDTHSPTYVPRRATQPEAAPGSPKLESNETVCS